MRVDDGAVAFALGVSVVVVAILVMVFCVMPLTNSMNKQITYQNSITTHLVERMKR